MKTHYTNTKLKLINRQNFGVINTVVQNKTQCFYNRLCYKYVSQAP